VQAICAVEDAARVCPPLLHPRVDSRHRLRIEARIRGLPVEEARSGTHAVRVEREGDDVRVSLAGEVAVPDSDFNLQILLRRAESPQAFCAASVTNGAAFALLTILPPTARERDAATPPAPRDAIFLVDTSGSMAGESVGQARAGLKRCLRMLRPCDRFAIVRFADAFSFFAPDLLTATPDRLAAAEAYVDGLAADGGTMMHPALACALGLPDDGRAARLVIFLTDGCVGNENELMKLVAGRLGRARLFAFGIGSAPNEFLLRRVAEMGRGQAAFIRSQEDVGEAIADLFRTLDEPALTDVSVAWRDARGIAVPGVESYPDPPPDCFRDRPVQVVARLPAGFAGTVEVRGRRGGGDVSFEHAVDTAAAAGHPAVDRLFGAGRVNDLSYRELLAPSPEERKKLRDEIVATALRHRLVTAYTSRVAVEERIHRAPDGQLVTARVPTVLPKGWSASEFFPTASCEWLRILAGAILLGAGGGLGLLRGRRRAGP
jgi:Ca-activated chloride channel family protein